MNEQFLKFKIINIDLHIDEYGGNVFIQYHNMFLDTLARIRFLEVESMKTISNHFFVLNIMFNILTKTMNK